MGSFLWFELPRLIGVTGTENLSLYVYKPKGSSFKNPILGQNVWLFFLGKVRGSLSFVIW